MPRVKKMDPVNRAKFEGLFGKAEVIWDQKTVTLQSGNVKSVYRYRVTNVTPKSVTVNFTDGAGSSSQTMRFEGPNRYSIGLGEGQAEYFDRVHK